MNHGNFRRDATFDIVFTAANKRCFWCQRVTTRPRKKDSQRRLPNDSATMDHIKLKSHDGPDMASNLVLACRRCNLDRGSQDFVAYGMGAVVRLREAEGTLRIADGEQLEDAA